MCRSLLISEEVSGSLILELQMVVSGSCDQTPSFAEAVSALNH